ncbi:NAD(P)-dependent oxidoreductase [Nocardioides sp. KC13]|uniref:NAD(P)-dependent oxidoreductase n=1 Tax=Nocardioides turkmenicus TaxID=2711220 RepID=A0A6M1R7X3_9ACTN|nr:NAD(P)-binding domain-containing protein [Nocardioides sp. KC13]NGN95762.1 NAD(P)-dependent oxidoreductase [Nocardioides sp. KC13]
MNDHVRGDVAVIGLGAMGTALGQTLLSAGTRPVVWNRTPGRADGLVEAGARAATEVADAVSSAGLVLICVSDYDAVRSVLAPLEDRLAGRDIVNLTSGSSADARSLAAWVEERGARYLDGAILAVPAEIGGADTAILFSGSPEAYEAHRSTLETLAGRAAHLGTDPGLAAVHDAASLAIMWSVLNGFLHGAAVLKRAGVKAVDFLPIARGGITTTAGWLDAYAAQIDAGDHPGDDSTMATHVAAMGHLLEETVGAGVDTSVPAGFKALGDRAIEAGLADRGYTALVDLLLTETA